MMTTSADLTDVPVPALRSSCGHLALGENVQADVVHDELSSVCEPCGNHSSKVFTLSMWWPNTTVFRKRASSSMESNSVGSSCSQVLTSPKPAASRRAFVVLAAAGRGDCPYGPRNSCGSSLR